MEYNKLVRDNIPEIIKQQGKRVSVRTLRGEELKKALKDKLEEETQELRSAETREQILEELADVYDVLTAIRCNHGITEKEILQKRYRKGNERGIFLKGLFLVEVEE